jgi:hypothetical protein
MIAADRRRAGAALWALSRRVDRAANRALERLHPLLLVAAAFIWKGLRPALACFFRTLAIAEAGLRWAGGLAARAGTAGSRLLTPRRALGLMIAATGAAVVVSQFLDYHGVQIGQPGYAGLPQVVAKPPTVDVQRAGEAHSWLLVPLGAIGILCGLAAMSRGGRRAAFGAVLAGTVALAIVLLVDLPHGLDAGAQTSRFAGASAVLEQGFYAELASAGAMLMAGLLYIARPCLIRINSSGRAASARRRRPRPQDSSQGMVARRA